MKKIFAIILAVLMLLPCLAACAKEEPILPPVREGKSKIQSSMLFIPIEKMGEKADAIVHLKIKNWIGESIEQKRTYFNAEVIEVYKGDVPENIILGQSGTSKETNQGYPLFTYGEELILFLGKYDSQDNKYDKNMLNVEESEFDTDNIYGIYYMQLYVMNVATLNDGSRFVIPMAPYIIEQNDTMLSQLVNIGSVSEKGISDEAKSAASILKEIDPYDNPGTAPEYVFSLEDYVKYLKGCSK